ncbi:MAG: LptA/OstA family protein, partial [Candidatus Puniceispirillales bacterium]
MLFRPNTTIHNHIIRMCCLITFLCIWAGLGHAQDNTQPVDFSADSMESNQDTGIFIATGNVVFEQGRMTLKADRVEYHRDTGLAEASGSVVFTDHQGNIHFSDQMTMGKEFSEAFAEPIISQMVDQSWMAGDRGEYYKDDYTLYDNAIYTPCDCDFVNGETPIWRFETSSSWHDPKTKTVYHTNIQMKVLDLHVLYFPYLSHPDWS